MLIVVKFTFAAVTISVGGRQLVCLPRSGLLSDPVPHALGNLLVVKTLKNTIASNQEEVEVILQFE